MLLTTPLDYQKPAIEKARAVLAQHNFAPLFIEMGLGKTFISLLLADNYENIFIVCPKAILKPTWIKEIKKHLGENIPIFIYEPAKKSEKNKKAFEIFANKKEKKIFIANIEAFQSKLKKDFKNKIKQIENNSIIILDESSYIKNINAVRTKNLINIGKLFNARLILTGTEITNSVLDLYSQMLFLKEDFWAGIKNYHVFMHYYAKTEKVYLDKLKKLEIIYNYKNGIKEKGVGDESKKKYFTKVVGYKNTKDLMRRIEPYAVRLRKKDIPGLPLKLFDVIKFDMPNEMRELRDTLKKKLLAQYAGSELTVMQKSTLFVRFRQICGGIFPTDEKGIYFPITKNPKFDFILAESNTTEKKAIVWDSFVVGIKDLKKKFDNEKISSSVYYGEVENGEEEIRKFETENRLFIANPAKGGFGLNLQFCDLVYYYTLPTSCAQFWQSQDRCHRIGQVNNVQYKILIYNDSVEERIYNRLQQNKDIADDFANMALKDILDLV